MKKVLAVFFALIFTVVLMQGCGGGGGSDSSSPSVSENSAGDGLFDLGDLVEPAGDHWYFTEAVGINDNGVVIGSSNNNGMTSRGAFMWIPETSEMTFLGTDRELNFSEAADINNNGEVIVNSFGSRNVPDVCGSDPKFESTALWRDGLFVSLPAVAKFSNDINEKGEVVGRGLSPDPFNPGKCISSPFYWDGRSGISDFYLPQIVGAEFSEAIAINEHSQIVINSDDTVVFYDRNHEVWETLNHLPGAVKTVAVDINDSIYTNNDGIPDGHVIGNSGDFSQEVLEKVVMGKGVNAFVQQDEPSVDVEEPTQQPAENPSSLEEVLLGTYPPTTAADFVFALGDSDNVVKQSPDGEVIVESLKWNVADVQGFFWDGGAMYPISGFGAGFSAVTDLNNNDEVVGGAITENGETHAFMWTLNANGKGVVRDLGTLGGKHSFALAINEAGQIVGWSTTGEFYTEEGLYMPIIHGFLWENGRMYDLGTHNYFYNYPFMPSYPFSVAVDINEPGELTGNSLTINAHSRGFYSQVGASAP